MNARAQALAGGAIAAIVAVALHRMQVDALAGPSTWRPDDVLAWVDDAGMPTVAMSLLRYATIAVALYVTAAAMLVVVASSHPSAPLVHVARVATPRSLRRALGVGALATLALPAGVASSRTPLEAPPVLVEIDGGTTAREVRVSRDANLPTLVWQGPAASPQPLTIAEDSQPAPHAPPSTLPPSTWVVRPGDHFWSIATTTVTAARPDADPAEIERYWRDLIDANRGRLVIPDQPDLVFAGQQLLLPPVDR